MKKRLRRTDENSMVITGGVRPFGKIAWVKVLLQRDEVVDVAHDISHF